MFCHQTSWKPLTFWPGVPHHASRFMCSHVWQAGSVRLHGVWKEQTDFERPWIEPQCSRASRPGVSESSQLLSPFCGVRYESASMRPLSHTMRALGNMIGCRCIINADGQLTCCRLARDSPELQLGSARLGLIGVGSDCCWWTRHLAAVGFGQGGPSPAASCIFYVGYCKRLVELDWGWAVWLLIPVATVQKPATVWLNTNTNIWDIHHNQASFFT